jgi:hypothetical protein
VLGSWLVTLWGRPLDPMVSFYALVGLGGLAGLLAYLRHVGPAASAVAATRPSPVPRPVAGGTR